MQLSDFDYQLPEDLIAQTPLAERGASRLLLVDPHADPRRIEERLRRCTIRLEQVAPLTNAVLVRRGLLNHFPSLIVFDSGALMGRGWPGYHAMPVVRSYLRSRLQ